MKQQPELKFDNSQLETAIDRAIDFFWINQLPGGEFTTYVTERKVTGITCNFDSCNFSTALILYALSFLRETPKIEKMRLQGRNFLLDNMVRPGIWYYYSSINPFLHTLFSPPDIDTTSCTSFVLKKYGIVLNNKKLLLANRNQDDLISTWIVPRFSMLFTHTGYWLKYRLITPSYSQWWKKFPSVSNEADLGASANLVFYLGEIEETKKVIDYLIDVTLKGKEIESDTRYLSIFPHYYFLSRAYFNGVKRLEVLKEKIISNLEQKFEQEGFDNSLDTALAACTFLNFGQITPTLEKAIDFLLANQGNDGSWAISPFYFDSPKRISWYGSAELTTGVCIEALVRYQQAI
ncbi:hypothetical protein [Geminocystis sp. GBBB08]|uniref:hypothetical protein n=1 Tax=Geminocystis sp. GBBB08 TaxID=2604140 RepID=UPI0027E24399|nr:hypothetical protein [Geminocystis sp. GBBB08]MBL1210216.1 hypothetical protein [Geminocystis sp. GBBB08]